LLLLTSEDSTGAYAVLLAPSHAAREVVKIQATIREITLLMAILKV